MADNQIIKYDNGQLIKVGNAIAVTEKLLTSISLNKATVYYLSGVEKVKQKEYLEAVQEFSNSISFNPEYAVAICSRGFAKHKLNKYLEAIEDYSRGIELYPGENLYHFYYLRGVAKKDLNDYSEAIKDFTLSINMKLDYASAYNDRGISNKNLNNHLEAINDFSKVIELNPNYYYGAAFYNRAISKLKIGDKSAFDDLKEAEVLGSKDATERLAKYNE